MRLIANIIFYTTYFALCCTQHKDDVLTTGQSVVDYKEEIERCGGKVVAAIFYGKTLSMPSMLLVQIHVWGNHIAHIIERMTK